MMLVTFEKKRNQTKAGYVADDYSIKRVETFHGSGKTTMVFCHTTSLNSKPTNFLFIQRFC